MQNISRDRGRLPACQSGLGLAFTTPTKKRNPKRKLKTLAHLRIDHAAKRQRCEEELTKLLGQAKGKDDEDWEDVEECRMAEDTPQYLSVDSSDVTDPYNNLSIPSNPVEANLPEVDPIGAKSSQSKRLLPDQSDFRLHVRWKSLIPTLVDDLLQYYASANGRPASPITTDELRDFCSTPSCPRSTHSSILLLYFDYFKTISVSHCACRSVPQILVRAGVFPTAPSQMRMAVSIEFLDFYAALFERSCDAVHAMANGLNTFYNRRGFYLKGGTDDLFREPFRRGFGYAAQWMDILRIAVEDRVDAAVERSDFELRHSEPQTSALKDPLPSGTPIPHPHTSSLAQHETTSTSCPQPPDFLPVHEPKFIYPLEERERPKMPIPPGSESSSPLSECARSLRQLCPACFGGNKFGKSLDEGGDFHVSTDGNFHHRHLASGGAGIPFHKPKHIIPKEFVDAVGTHIQEARKASPRQRTSKVPNEAVDECQNSYEAADGDKKKASEGGPRYDAQGWMAMVCRHDIPLFFANIDTPGEQQKYAIALIIWLFALVPPSATMTVLYDIGCVLHRSLELFDILPVSMTSHMQLATSAMHAYGHQWACQLAYNPRLMEGMGLSDGEGNERTWSKLRKLIVLVRTSSHARRIWLTDRQLSAVAAELRDGLGDWINNRLRKGVEEQGDKARRIVHQSGIPIPDLRGQWTLQKKAQLSVRAHAPTRLRKELDTVLALQTELEDIERAIQTARSALLSAPKKSGKILNTLIATHKQLSEHVEALYLSLNLQESFPTLEGVDLSFVRILVMARDLKINIRKRAIGSFFEWDRLDQAAGGRNQALGTKLHQQTRKAITKRQPALLSSIKKYNKYCSQLEELYDASYKIPLPLPLPTKLADLRNDPSLMEDVWITQSEVVPLWLEDQDVRTGIRALLKMDRCLEERRRLGIEADNLCSWFGRELLAIETSLRDPLNSLILVELERRKQHLLHMKTRYTTPLASSIRYDTHVKLAVVATQRSMQLDQDRHHAASTHVVEDEAGGIEDDDAASLPDTSDMLMAETLDNSEESQTFEDSSTFAHEDDSLQLREVQFPNEVKRDSTLLDELQTSVIPPSKGGLFAPRYIGNLDFQQSDLCRLDRSMMLNDVCLNGAARYLQEIYVRHPTFYDKSSQCALFSTHDLVRIRYKASDHDLWRNVSQTEFWTKSRWIIPIHRRRDVHWVLAVVDISTANIYLYDSLADRRKWTSDIEAVVILCRRLIHLAHQHNKTFSTAPPTKWSPVPLSAVQRQTNGYDCGLWVLAWATAALRGFLDVGDDFTEDCMPFWREFLSRLVRSLPTTPPR